MSLFDRFLNRVSPIDVGDGPLRALVHAITSPMEWLDDLVHDSDTHSAWGRVMDPDAAPASILGWLGQLGGVTFLPSDDEAAKRARILAQAGPAGGFHRGTAGAMIATVKLTLTGTQYVNLIQQAGGNRWALTLVTRPAETPDAALTYAAALRQKPAGINLQHVLTNDVLWIEATKTWTAVLGGVTWTNVASGDV